ncbi:MAG: ABC transporter ATP-binding protein [Phycisphaeraceae bacterium]
MTQPLAIIEAVGKQYPRTPNARGSYGLRDVFRRIAGRPTRADRGRDFFWAVRDVSLRIQPGETIGIIGVNGSGKTTLLRLIAGMIRPDTGSVDCRGEMQAIINLNAGFNPRLNGLENIQNALSLRGFSGQQAKQRLDRIIDFAELGEFIEHPVAHYSTGMNARLAFASCIHLDPDLLLIDEALSVGDHGFKNKCLLKVAELKARGVAMLFVSHSMGQIEHFCTHTLWLHRGDVKAFGPSRDVIKTYLEWADQYQAERQETMTATDASIAQAGEVETDPRYGELYHVPAIISAPTCRINDADTSAIEQFQPMTIHYTAQLHQPVQDPTLVIKIHRHDGLLLARLSSRDDGNDQLGTQGPGRLEGRMTLHDVNLMPGAYVLIAEIVTGSRAFLYRGVIGQFTVRQRDCHVNGLVGFRRDHEIRCQADDANSRPANSETAESL